MLTPRKHVPRMAAIHDSVVRGVLRLGLLERRHAVGHGLHAGQRDGAAGERAQQHVEAEAPVALLASMASSLTHALGDRADVLHEDAVRSRWR